MASLIQQRLTRIGTLASHPAAFGIFALYVVLWFVFDPATLNWNAGATLATWLMTLFIQRAGHRDTQALQGKLDELLRVQEGARSELTKLDQLEPEEIERHRAGERPPD
jgi:low affinity Fe/Cu permease